MSWLDYDTLSQYGIAPAQQAGVAAPQQAQTSPSIASLGNAANKSGIYGLSSDQQLAYYRQLLSKFAPAQYTPVQGNFEQGGEGAGSDQQAQQNAANAQVDVARNAAFEQTLSPEDRANYQALSKQYETNSNHSMDNMGIFSLLAAGVGGGLAGAYGGAAGAAADGAAGTGVAGGSAATGNMALIESGLGTAGYGGAGAAGTTGGLAAGGGAVGGGTLGFTGGSGAGLSGASGETIGSNVGYQLGAQSAAGSAPAYSGVGTAGAGAGTDAVIGADGLAYGPTAGGGIGGGAAGGSTGPGFWSSLASGNYGDAASAAGSAAGNYFSSPSGLQSLAGLAGSYLSSKTQSDAAQRAAQMSMDQYNQTRADNAPYRQAGYSALGQIGDLMGTSGNTGAANYGMLTHQFGAGDLNANLAPNWKFQLDQGVGAATNAANASGFSGNALKGINDYAQNYAGNAYQQAYNNYTNNQTNVYNRLSNLAGLGQTSNGITAQSGTANTANATNYLTSGAAAQAGGIVGGVNSLNNGITNYQGWNYLNGRAYQP